MIELVVAACLVDVPKECNEFYLNFESESVTPQMCVINGQIEMAKWLQDHPQWRIKKWRCGKAGQVAKT